MGEHSAMKSIMDVMKNKLSIGLGVIGLKFMDDLGQPLKKLSKSMDIGKHAEIDIMNLYCNGDTVTVAFGECKVLQSLQKTSPDQFKKKVKSSLHQAERDLCLFLKINPDLSQEDLERINLITLSILPATISDNFNICKDCSNSVVFREDLNTDYEDFDSIADLLHADILKSSKPGKAAMLSQKLQAETIMKPTKESLNIYRRISARTVGLASLYFPKATKNSSKTGATVTESQPEFSNFYHGTKSYNEAVTSQLQKVKTEVSYKLEKALFLSPEQTVAFNSLNFVATGFYGVGKTTVLEVAIDKIVEKPDEFPSAKIVFVTWDESHELKQYFKEKFQRIKDQNHSHLNEHDSLEVFSLEEVCERYNVKPMQSRWNAWLSSWISCERTKVDVINDLCKKLKSKSNIVLLISYF